VALHAYEYVCGICTLRASPAVDVPFAPGGPGVPSVPFVPGVPSVPLVPGGPGGPGGPFCNHQQVLVPVSNLLGVLFLFTLGVLLEF
jgi:hypothetical protein